MTDGNGRGTLLEASGISKVFGGLVAVNDVTFTVPEKAIVSLIGPNGAGKTTFFNCLTGLYRPTTGRVTFLGRDITGKRADIVTAAGIARTFQNIKLFRTMTALENVQVGMHTTLRTRLTGMLLHTPFNRKEEKASRETAAELLDVVGLKRRDELAMNLPYGDQRRLEIARAGRPAQAAAARRADGGHEPAGVRGAAAPDGEAAHRARHLRAAHRARHEGGHERVRPHHRARPRRAHRGGHAAGGPSGPARDRGLPREPGVTDAEEIREAAQQANGDQPLLRVDEIHTFYGSIEALKGITIEVNQGEIVTLIGSNGAGKSTTLRSISGIVPPKTGHIAFQGVEITGLPGHEVAALGIAQSPEGRRIFPRMTVRENLEMGAFTRRDKKAIGEDIDRVYSLFPRLQEREKQKGGTMSGGEQQMLAMGRALMAQPKLLLLDEPSLGLAPVIVDKIYEIIREINQQGTTILLVEQNANYALDVSQRGYVLETGTVALTDKSDALRTDERVMAAYLGG